MIGEKPESAQQRDLGFVFLEQKKPAPAGEPGGRGPLGGGILLVGKVREFRNEKAPHLARLLWTSRTATMRAR